MLGAPDGRVLRRRGARSATLDSPHMNALDSPKIATSIGTLVQRALDVRKQWSEQHVHRAAGDLKLKEQWEETEPFWKP